MQLFPISKNLAPEDKPVCQLQRKTSCKSEFAPIKMHTVNHVLCKSFLSLDPISVVSPVNVVNVNANFTLLRSQVHVVISHFRPLRVCLKSTNNFHRKHSISSKCLQHSLTHQSYITPLWSTSIHACCCSQEPCKHILLMSWKHFMFSSTSYRFYKLLFNFILSYAFV